MSTVADINTHDPWYDWKRIRVHHSTKSVTLYFDLRDYEFKRGNLIANGYGPRPVDTSSGAGD